MCIRDRARWDCPPAHRHTQALSQPDRPATTADSSRRSARKSPKESARQNACALRWGPPSVTLSGYSMVSGLVSGAVNAGMSRAADVSLSLVLACCAGLCLSLIHI